MKNTIKNIRKSILMAIMITASLSYANETATLKSKKEPVKKTMLTLKNVKQGHELLIKDTYGLTLYTEIINRDGVYSKGFDLSALPDGNYFFELNKDLEIKTIPFTVESSIVEFDTDLETTVFKPLIRVVDNKVYLSKLELDAEPISIKIYSEGNFNSELIYSETVKDTQIINKVFDVSELKGAYKIVLKTNNQTFNNFINI